MKNNLLALFGFILLTTSLPASAQLQVYGDFLYSTNGSTVTIARYLGADGAVTIPTSITGLPVTTIGDSAFFLVQGVTNVTIPGTVTSIDDYAFWQCHSVIHVTIPASVTNIGVQAFGDCSSLASITIPNSVTSIGAQAFWLSGSLIAITVDPANASYSSLDGVLFNKSQTELLEYPAGKAGSYAIPGSVNNIIAHAFSYCRLTSVTIPSSVTYLGAYSFIACGGLKEVFFKGNTPNVSLSVFDSASATIYYLPGTTGWGTTFAGLSTRLWNPLMQTTGVGPAGFGFNITGTADIPFVVEAWTNLVNASWVPLQSLNLTNGAFSFNDPSWTNYSSRFYRIRSP